MIDKAISRLADYGIRTGLIEETDRIYTINRLLELFGLEEYGEEDGTADELPLSDILKEMLDYAFEKGLIPENTVVYRDLFDTKIMGLLTPRPPLFRTIPYISATLLPS